MILYIIGIYLFGAILAFFIGYHHCFEYKNKIYVLKTGYTPNDALIQGITHGLFSWLVIIAFKIFKDE